VLIETVQSPTGQQASIDSRSSRFGGMSTGAAGTIVTVGFWMPTYLRTMRHLSASSIGLYVAVQQFAR
jgi:hypothetical protein